MNGRMSGRPTLAFVVGLALACSACDAATAETESTAAEGSAAPSASAPVASASATQGQSSVAAVAPPSDPELGIVNYVTTIFADPRSGAKKLGYARVGAKLSRSKEPAGSKGCKGGEWYEVFPRGFVCVNDKDATLDLDHPVMRAAKTQPDLVSPMPYRYGFVRAVLPLYLRIPTAAEQEESEFKLGEHLAWYAENKDEVDKVVLGAYDVPVDGRGVPIEGKQLGELGERPNSLEVGLGVLFGGATDHDPIPWWLEDGQRKIPNISGFEVPDTAVFANRARRFTGLGLVGAFKMGEGYNDRWFAITTDLRLAPGSKLKPDTASPFHGVEVTAELPLPLAWVRREGVSASSLTGDRASSDGPIAYRSVHRLTGKQQRVDGVLYVELGDGRWLDRRDVGVALAPSKWPKEAETGEKWVQVNTTDQVLVLWEGKKAVYTTLVSTGRKEFPTKPGKFRIFKKHITATMDSDEGSMSDDEKAEEGISAKGDGEYGITKRRGQGTYKLRDVPYIQYFNQGQALHTAYWHDVFGKARSHGCVNLAPVDAHRVFMWTEPAMPTGWHGLNVPEGQGTVVIVHE
jgi:lipoprotein-anchoring transpeptidase ErfK/SrfK